MSAPSSSEITVLPATAEHREGLVTLFARASNGCYCGWWHHEGDDYQWQARCNLEPEVNRASFVQALDRRATRAAGLVALIEGHLVGWLKLAPAAAMTKLYGRRVYRTLRCFDGDRRGVLVVGCVLVDPDHRREGVARALLAGAVEEARRRDAVAVEATPRRAREAVRDDELWMGPPSIFDEAGFRRVDDGPEAYPVLRLDLSSD